MKKLLVIPLLLFFNMTTYSQSTKLNADFRKLKWLPGTWVRTNNKPGQTGQEKWEIPSAEKLTGKGFTLKGADTVFVEKLAIIRKGNNLFYVVNTPTDPKPTYFKFTSITNDSFVCENPKHDFPQKIVYKRTGDKVKATISGQGESVDFFFVKKE